MREGARGGRFLSCPLFIPALPPLCFFRTWPAPLYTFNTRPPFFPFILDASPLPKLCFFSHPPPLYSFLTQALPPFILFISAPHIFFHTRTPFKPFIPALPLYTLYTAPPLCFSIQKPVLMCTIIVVRKGQEVF